MTDASLHIRDEGQGQPVVFIHGWSCPGQFFQQQVELLQGQARCIVPDLPGHGKTGAEVPLTIETAADAIYAYLEEQQLKDVVLCGWSMGALITYALIERHGASRIASVTSIDMSPKVLNSEGWANGTLSGLNEALNGHAIMAIVADWESLPARIAKRLFAGGRSPDPDLLSYATAEIAKADPNLLQPMWVSLTAQDFRSLLRKFPVPLHLAAGLKSQLYGEGVHRWHQENVPDFQLYEFENSGHAPHLEEPERFAAMMRLILNQCSGLNRSRLVSEL